VNAIAGIFEMTALLLMFSRLKWSDPNLWLMTAVQFVVALALGVVLCPFVWLRLLAALVTPTALH
jgi:hypothetical protein